MSPEVRQILAGIGIAVILALVMFFADRQQPDALREDKDPDEPQVLEEDDL